MEAMICKIKERNISKMVYKEYIGAGEKRQKEMENKWWWSVLVKKFMYYSKENWVHN